MKGFHYIKEFTNGRAIVNENGLWGVIDTRGNYVVEPQYAYIYSYADDRAVVESMGDNGRTAFGVIDLLGNIVIPIGKWNRMHLFYNNGLLGVQDGTSWGFVDLDGRIVIPTSFPDAGMFSEGYAWVAVMEKEEGRRKEVKRYGYIDRQGSIVLAPRYEQARPVKENFASVMQEGKWFHVRIGISMEEGQAETMAVPI